MNGICYYFSLVGLKLIQLELTSGTHTLVCKGQMVCMEPWSSENQMIPMVPSMIMICLIMLSWYKTGCWCWLRQCSPDIIIAIFFAGMQWADQWLSMVTFFGKYIWDQLHRKCLEVRPSFLVQFLGLGSYEPHSREGSDAEYFTPKKVEIVP